MMDPFPVIEFIAYLSFGMGVFIVALLINAAIIFVTGIDPFGKFIKLVKLVCPK